VKPRSLLPATLSLLTALAGLLTDGAAHAEGSAATPAAPEIDLFVSGSILGSFDPKG